MMGRMNMGRQIATAPASRMGQPMPQVMKKGGKVAKKAAGGAVKGYAKGGMAGRGDGCCMKGKTKGAMK